MQQTPHARSIIGNHERKHVRSFRDELAPALSQRITRRQFGEARYPAVCAALQQLLTFIQLPEALLVHGFYEPGVQLEAQRDTVLIGTLSGDAYLRQRYERPWYELYDGDRPIIVGHSDYLHNGQPFVYRERVYGVDTGCCRGGALTGLLLPEFRFVSVPSRADYWAQVQAAYRTASSGGTAARADDEFTWEELQRALSARAGALLTAERLKDLRDLRERSEALLGAVLEHIRRESERLLVEACSNGDSEMGQSEAAAFAGAVGHGQHAGLFHLARKGMLSEERLRIHFKTPAALAAFAADAGVSSRSHRPAVGANLVQ